MTPAIDRPCRGPRSVRNSSSTRRRWASAATAAVTAALLAGVVGCDDHGNSANLTAQAEATGMLRAGGEPSAEAIQKLESVASSDRASPIVVQSRRTLASAKLDVAKAQANKLAELETAAMATLYEIAATTNQAQSSATLAGVYQRFDPRGPNKSIQQLQAFSKAAKGDGSSGTFATVPDATIPTLAAVDAEKGRLEGELAKQESQLADLTKQRDAKLSAAGEASGKADREKGEARLTLVKEVAASRQAAAELSRQIDALNVAIADSRADLAVQDGLKQQLADAVETFDKQATVVTTGWTEVSKKANGLTSQAKATLGGDKDSVKTLAATLDGQLKAIADQRETVEKAFTDAIAAFDSASTLAGTLTRELGAAKSNGEAFEAAAWDVQAKLAATDPINLDKAAAERAMADFKAGGARLLALQTLVATSLERTAKPLDVKQPASLTPFELKKALGASIQEADKAYEASLTTLEGVTLNGGDSSTRSLRDTLKILSMYDRALLATSAKELQVAPELAANEKLLKDALEVAKEAQASEIALPKLPAAVTPPPLPKAPAEGAAPATEGAAPAPAAPAEGATPATEGAAPAPAAPAEGAAPAAPAAPADADPAAAQ